MENTVKKLKYHEIKQIQILGVRMVNFLKEFYNHCHRSIAYVYIVDVFKEIVY